MFSCTAEYALRAVTFLAASGPVAVNSATVARRTRTPAEYIAKILKVLVAEGLVIARRGPGGGFRLARSPEQIRLLDVVNAVDPIRRIGECPMRLAEHEEQLCPMHQCLDDAIARVERSLRTRTIADILRPPEGGKAPLVPVVEVASNGHRHLVREVTNR